jgi:GNAT superfamily N-acetyltransferase
VELTWLDPAHLDPRDVAGAVALLEAARVVDCPHELGPTTGSFMVDLRYGGDGEPSLFALARDDHGRVNGLLEVGFPRRDNTHLGFVDVTVDPAARRQGLGRRLFEAGVDRVCSEGRTLVHAETWDRPASVAFAAAMGLRRASADVQRRLDLTTLDRARLDNEHTKAESRAAGYALVRMAGTTPDDMIEDVARMAEAINDAPIDDLDIDDEVISPERVRAFEEAEIARGRRLYRLVAREHATGELAGHTVVAVEAERPWHGEQHDTSVTRAHRGHRLGLLLKIAMLRWLAEEEPQLRTVDTWNAASNAHMIGVNEVLGYQVVAHGIGWQRRL